MDDLLKVAALADPHRLLSSTRLTELGIGPNQLSRLVRNGLLIRVRRGQLIRRVDWPDHRAERHVVQVAAVLANHADHLAASHHSAALASGLPVYGCDLRMIRTVRREPGKVKVTRPSGARPGLAVAQPPPGPDWLTDADGLAVCTPAWAGLQIAMQHGIEAGVVTLDAALHRGACTQRDLDQIVAILGARRGSSSARQAARLADGRAESPGESRLRICLLRLGYAVEPQAKIYRRTSVFAVVDLYLREHRIIVEFDGAVKYRTDASQDGSDVLVAEKAREDLLRQAGFEIVRVVWAELDHPEGIRSAMEFAIRRARARRPKSAWAAVRRTPGPPSEQRLGGRPGSA